MTVEQVCRERLAIVLLGLGGAVDLGLLVLLDLLLHLDLGGVSLLCEHLGPETTQVLGILGYPVAFTRLLLTLTLLVIETATVLLDGLLNVLVLRLLEKRNSIPLVKKE